MLRTKESDGTKITHTPEEVSETLTWLASEASRGQALVSDVSQEFKVIDPLENGSIRFEITTLAGTWRRERWDQDKVERYLEAGFLTRYGSRVHDRWTEPQPVLSMGDHRGIMVNDDLTRKITMRKVEDLASRLFDEGKDDDALLVKWVIDQANMGMFGRSLGHLDHRPEEKEKHSDHVASPAPK